MLQDCVLVLKRKQVGENAVTAGQPEYEPICFNTFRARLSGLDWLLRSTPCCNVLTVEMWCRVSISLFDSACMWWAWNSLLGFIKMWLLAREQVHALAMCISPSCTKTKFFQTVSCALADWPWARLKIPGQYIGNKRNALNTLGLWSFNV